MALVYSGGLARQPFVRFSGGVSLATALGFLQREHRRGRGRRVDGPAVRGSIQRPELTTLKEFFGLMVGAALLGTLPGATIGAATLIRGPA